MEESNAGAVASPQSLQSPPNTATSPRSLQKQLAIKDKQLRDIKEKAKEYIFNKKADLKQKDARIKKLEENLRELRAASDSQAKDLKALKLRHEKELAKRQKLLQDREEEFKKEREGITEKNKRWAAQREESHSTDLSTLQENNTLLKRKYLESQEELKELNTKVLALTQELSEKQKEMSEYKQKVRAKIERANMNIRAKKDSELELDALRHKVAWAERRIVNMQKQLLANQEKEHQNSLRSGNEDRESKLTTTTTAAGQQTGKETPSFSRTDEGGSKDGGVPSTSNSSTNGLFPTTSSSSSSSSSSSNGGIEEGGGANQQLKLLRSEMQKEELKAKHAAELAKVQESLMGRISALQTQLAEQRKFVSSSSSSSSFDAAGGTLPPPPSSSSSSRSLERSPSDILGEEIEGDEKSLKEQVEYWREEKRKADVEVARMEQALESWRDQLSGNKELSVSNLRLQQSLADANRAKLQAQQHALKLTEELNQANKKVQVLHQNEEKIKGIQKQKTMELQTKLNAANEKLQSTNLDQLRSQLNQKFQKEMKSFKESSMREIQRLQQVALIAKKQAESDRKKRNYAKTEFLKVFGELETLRKKIGEMRIQRDVSRKRFVARITDLENLLGLDVEFDGGIGGLGDDDESIGGRRGGREGGDQSNLEEEEEDNLNDDDDDDDLDDDDYDFDRDEGGSSLAVDRRTRQQKHHGVRSSRRGKHKQPSSSRDVLLFDVELLEVPRTLADVSYQMIKKQCASISKRIDKYIEQQAAHQYSKRQPVKDTTSSSKPLVAAAAGGTFVDNGNDSNDSIIIPASEVAAAGGDKRSRGGVDLFDQKETKKKKKIANSPEEVARAIKMDLEGILNMMLEVAAHQRKCQVAITNLGANVGGHLGQGSGFVAGIRLICGSMCGGVTPTGVPRRERGGQYKYQQVN